ncbi:secreted RxLR effector protein 161-like [Humulus lupulus]|uniref:secreted RxLR effector protein 161-like n=1 Tax=Humulus lupulus TaxID=3486 RepID=UPI002B408E08|nr:secreted RxLR effector protein 161-like [Humulus lupulus]
MSKVSHSTAVGSIMYSMVNTRLDLSYSIGLLSKFMSNPRKAHWTAMKHVLRYIASTTELGLKYEKVGDLIEVEGYVDANFSGDKDSSKSTTAYVFMVSGNCISWKSQLQPIVTLSTTEAKYVATTEAIKEGFGYKDCSRC